MLKKLNKMYNICFISILYFYSVGSVCMDERAKLFTGSTVDGGFSLLVAAFPVGTDKKIIFTDSKTPNCWIIEYVISGRGFLQMPPFDYHPSGGNLYILPKSGQSYSFYADPADPWRKVCILIDGNLVERLIEVYGLAGKHFFAKCEDLFAIFNQIYGLKNTSEESQYEALVLVNKLFCSLRGREITAGGIRKQKDENDIASKLRIYIEEGIECDVSIEDFCMKFKVNKSSIIRTFGRRYGMAPYAYLMSCRFARAQALLKFSSMPLKEIASRLCFADQYHFSNYFKKKQGVSPSAYRKNI